LLQQRSMNDALKAANDRASMVELLKQSGIAWTDDYAPSMGAALSYYTLFSLAPLLLLVIAVAGLVFNADVARGEVLAQLGGLIGTEGSVAIEGLLNGASRPTQSLIASVIGIVTLIVGATSSMAPLLSGSAGMQYPSSK
jgi:membrane protein